MGATLKPKPLGDPAFGAYGRVIEGYDLGALMDAMQYTPLPEDVVYVASVEQLETLPIAQSLGENVFGQMPIQVGYCNGHNKKLNALEYHRCSEINIAVTDMAVILGKLQDVDDRWHYDTSKAEAFLVPAGTMVEFYGTTLHYAPCHVDGGAFRCVVALPRGTNEAISPYLHLSTPEDKLLFARNKWLIGHREGGLGADAFIGLDGENYEVE
ncbi:MAG: DUF4867 family protein [Lachnospiraceae bacterium]|nr:DUF4867 family protein [Lachnospiraceae bacterium]